jgi:hypothetical protein
MELELINALTTLNELMAEIREIVHHPDREGNEVVIMIPVLEPEFYPEIPPEHFPEFKRYILEKGLRREHIIMPGHEVAEIDTTKLPAFPSPPKTTPGPGDNIDYTRQLEEIRRQQERQTELLEEQNRHLQNIEDEARSIPQRIGDVIVGQPDNLDFSPLEDLRAVSGVFPFSIPWDLRNAFLAMFGGSVAAAPAPVFEIDLTDTVLASKLKIDFAEYETMAIVVRWGIMGLFVIGLISATGRLIKW